MEYSVQIKEKQRLNIVKTMRDDKYNDVTFIIGENQTEFRTNRLLLAFISDVFGAMLFGPMQEGKAESVITIYDVDDIGFKSVLNFATSDDPKVTIENVVSVKNICRKYDISDLAVECDEYFESCINAKTICILLDQSIKYKLDDYVQKCMEKLKVIDIVNSDGFTGMQPEAMCTLLQCDHLKAKEEDLWEAVLKWADNQSKGIRSALDDSDAEPPTKRRRLNAVTNNPNTAGNSRLELLRGVSQYIRFGLMDSAYFVGKVESTGCLSKDEVLAVLKYIAMRKRNPNYHCDKFCTKPRSNPLPLHTFTTCNRVSFDVSDNGLDLKGKPLNCHHSCYAYTSSVPCSGIHFWSVLLVKGQCHHRNIGVTRDIQRFEDPDHFVNTGRVKMYRGQMGWMEGGVMTVVLDYDNAQIHYYRNERKIFVIHTIDNANIYHFALYLCAKGHCRVILVLCPSFANHELVNMALSAQTYDTIYIIIRSINIIQSFIFLILYIQSYRILKSTLVEGISKYLKMIMRISMLLAAAYFLRYILSICNQLHPDPRYEGPRDFLFIVGHGAFYLIMMLRLHFVFRGTKYGLSRSTERVLLISWTTIILCDSTYFIAKAHSADNVAISFFFFQTVILDIMFTVALINIFTQKLTKMGLWFI